MMHRTTAPMLALALGAVVAPGAAFAQEPFALDTLHVEVGSRASASLPVAVRGVEVFSAREIAAMPARNLAEALAWALGADLLQRSPAQADLAIRGATFEQILVLVDGVRMSDAQTAHFDLDLAIPLAEVERIEVLRGPASTLYGSDAVGGVVNIVTRRGETGVAARLEGGSFGTLGAAASVAGGVGAHAYRVAGELRRSDGHRPGTDDRLAQGRAALDARLGDRTLRADLAFAARDFGARGFYTAPDAPYDEYEETRTATASLAWLAPAGARLAVEPRLDARRHDDTFVLRRDDPGFYRNRHTSWQLGGEVTARYVATPALRVAVGGEAYRDILESTSLGDREESRAALFAEAAAGRADGASASLGLRADWHSTFGTFLAPSLAGAVRPARALRVRASIGRAFRAPSWTERYYRDPANIGDPDLDAERAWEAELGTEIEPAPGIRLAVAGFVRHGDGLIDWARANDAEPTDPWHTRNVQDARFRGLEAEGHIADLLGASWTLGFTALSVEAEESDGFISKYALRPLVRTATLAFDRELGGGVSIGMRARHARREGESSSLRSDLRLAYARGQARVYLDVLNLGDEDHLDVSGLPAPGRAVYVGLSWGGGSH